MFAAGGATLLDTSTNGTWINDEKLLKSSKELRDGDKVKLYNAAGEPTIPCAIFTFRLEPASASASASEEAVSGGVPASSGAAARGGGAFSSQLLGDVLCAALPTKVVMRDFVQAVKAKSEAFKSVQLSSKADGAYSNTQIAERIAECKPDQVTDAEGLLSWLIKVRAVVACA